MKTEWAAAGVEISADRKRTWLALASAEDGDGRVILEMTEPHAGPHSAAAVAALCRSLRVPLVALDPRSPSATLVKPLERETGVRLRLPGSADIAAATGLFQDALTDGRLRIRGHGGLDEAVRAATSRPLAGAVAPDRRAGVDMAPLLAAELGLWCVLAADPAPEPFVFYGGPPGPRAIRGPGGAIWPVHGDD